MADAKDFENEALAHLDGVYRVALALTGRSDRADDLVQTTYLKALKRFDSFRRGTNCRAWLLTILRNAWLDECRHAGVAGVVIPIEEAVVADAPPPETTHWSNAEDLLENFSDEQVIAAMGELGPEQRLTLFLVDVEGLSHDEVAEITGVPTGTVKSRSGRARERLRQRLFDHARDLGLTEGAR